MLIEVDLDRCDSLVEIIKKRGVTSDEDLVIRGATYEVVQYISKKLELIPEATHHIFWNLFRNCCNRETPHCDNCSGNCALPTRYRLPRDQKCMLAESCSKKVELLEHNFQTDWY